MVMVLDLFDSQNRRKYPSMFFIIGKIACLVLLITGFDISAEAPVPIVDRIYQSRADSLNDAGFRMWNVDPALTLKHGLEALELSVAADYMAGAAEANRIIGIGYWILGESDLALGSALNGLKLYEELKDDSGTARLLNLLGLIYDELNQTDIALNYHQQALDVYMELGDSSRIATSYNNIAALYVKTGDYNSAYDFFRHSLDIRERIDHPFGIAESMDNLGVMERYRGNYDESMRLSQHALAIRMDINDINGQILSLENIGIIYRILEQYDISKSYLMRALELARSTGIRKRQIEIYDHLIQLERTHGNYTAALEFFDLWTAQRDTLFNEEKARQISNIEMGYKNELNLREIADLEKEQKIAALIRNSLIAGFLMLGVVGLLVLNRQRLKNRYQLSELDNARLKEEQLRLDLEIRNKKLTTQTLHLVQKNEIMKDLKQNIRGLKGDPDIAPVRKLRTLENLVDYSFRLDSDWDEFRRYFEEVHNGFFDELKEKFPSITPNELRLAALVRLNLNIKEMSALMGISPDSVKTARYRLRRKMGLGTEENLAEYLMTIRRRNVV
jgi:tetratricopeptide (TPR) repeat protein